MTDEYRSLGLAATSFRNDGGVPSRLRTFGEPIKTLAVGHELDSDTFALWRMNETEYQGALVHNSTQSATAAYSRRSTTFDGVNEYVTVGNVSELSFERTDSFSISFWFKTSSTSLQYLITKMSASTANTGYAVSSIGSGTVGAIRFQLASNVGSGNYLQKTTTSAYNDGEWHHAVISYGGSSAASGILIYIDGSLASTTTNLDALSATTVTTAAFEIGDASAASSSYTGDIDEVIVFDKEVSSSEVASLYNGGVPIDPRALVSNVVGYWRMGDGDVYPTITDHSGSGNDGTMTNMEVTDITREVPSGRTLAPSTPSDWTFVPLISYGPGGKKQPCRWFRGPFFDNNLQRAGQSDFVSLLTGDHTIEVWVYIEDLSVGSHTIMEYSGTGEAEADNYLQRVLVTSTGRIALFWEYGAGSDAGFTTTSIYITERTWHHIAVSNVVVTGDRTAKVYVDGDFKESTTDTNASGGTSADFSIGCDVEITTNKMFGAMADMRFSSKERTAAEIAASAADYQHILDSDTFALWRFNDRPAIEDEVGNYPLVPMSFSEESGIVSALINDNGRAKSINSTKMSWSSNRTLIRDFLDSGDQTFELWFRVEAGAGTGSVPSSRMRLFLFNSSGEAEGENVLIQVQFETTGHMEVFWEYGTGNDVSLVTTDPVIGPNDWWTSHHIAITRSIGASTDVQIYCDGVLVQEWTGQTNPSGGTDVDVEFRIGDSSTETFILDDVRLSSKVRTAGEIVQSHARGTPIDKITRYRKRARDQGSEPAIVYVEWETTDPDGSFPGIIPNGGPLVEEVILDKFQV